MSVSYSSGTGTHWSGCSQTTVAVRKIASGRVDISGEAIDIFVGTWSKFTSKKREKSWHVGKTDKLPAVCRHLYAFSHRMQETYGRNCRRKSLWPTHSPHFPKLGHILHPQNGKNIPPAEKRGRLSSLPKIGRALRANPKNFASGSQSACVIALAMTLLFATALCAGGSGSPIIGSLFLLPLRRVGFVVTRLGNRRAFMMIDNRTHAFHRLSF